MAVQIEKNFSTFQGRRTDAQDVNSFRRRMRLPVATLALGVVAAVAIAGGALDRIIFDDLSSELNDVHFLTGNIDVQE